MKTEQLAFLIEILKTPGLSFPIDKCKVAYETQEALAVEWQRASETQAPPAAPPKGG